jgi:hypothetical protein
MTFFKNLSADGLEKQEDRVGGGGGLWDTGVYDGRIKMAYAGKYKSGAQFIALTLAVGSREYRQQILITNGKGENYYTKDSKKIPLMGFSMIDSLCMLATESPLSAQDVEEKVINIYDFEQKKEVPTATPVLVSLLNQPITFAIEKQLVNKQEKNGNGDYVDTAEETEKNELQKFYHTETKLTITEAEAGLEEGVFYHKWKEANTDENGVGKTRDRRKKASGGATSGKPPVPAASSGAPKKSLFGKKS